MKICFITTTYSPAVLGGANVYVERVARGLSLNGNEVIVITIDHHESVPVKNEQNIKVYKFFPCNISTFSKIGKASFIQQGIWTLLDIYSPYSYMKIKNVLKREKPDVVHIHAPLDVTMSSFDAVKSLGMPLVFTLNDYLLLCRRIVLLHGFKIMCTNQNMHPLCKIYRFFSKKTVCNKPDVVIAPSNFVLELFKKNGFFKSCKSIILPYGIEINDSYLSKKEKKSGNFNILYVGSLTSHKGVQILIESVKGIENKNLRLNIVGDGNYKNSLIELAGDDERIIFHGKINNDEIGSFYNNANVLVVPSIWYEVLGIVILESFRAGVPVVGSRIGGIPEVIKDGYNGYLFDAGDTLGLKKILENLIENPEELAILGRNAHESVLKYEMQGHLKKLIEIYKEASDIKNAKRHINQ